MLTGKVSGSVIRSIRLKALIQRHPEGAGMTIDSGEVNTEIQNPPPLESDSETQAAPQAAPGAGTTPEAAPQTGAAPETTPGTETGAEGTTSAVTDTTPAPAPATPQAMDLSTAQKLLQSSYGTVHTVLPGNIVLLAGQPPLWDKYDEINLGRRNPHNNNQPWKKTDAKTYLPGLQGFAEKGTVYVNQQTPLTTATAHEMLHNNTASDFRAAVGETINEGATEYLAKKALTEAGVPLGTAVAYPTQVGIVEKLVNLVGERTLITSYFNGANTLIRAYELIHGSGIFPLFRHAAENLMTSVTDLLLSAPSLQTKIAMINELLNGWVTNMDLSDIELICRSIDAGGMVTVRAAIQPRITELVDIGQRTRLRAILGTV